MEWMGNLCIQWVDIDSIFKKHILTISILNHVFSLVHLVQLDISVKQGRDKVREMCKKNAHVTDPRVVDLLVIKVTDSPWLI